MTERRIGITEGLKHLDAVQAQVKQEPHEAPTVEPTQMRVQPLSSNELRELREWKKNHRSDVRYFGQP